MESTGIVEDAHLPGELSAAGGQARIHLDFIDGIRALAALFVVVCHAYYEPANGYHKNRILTHLGLTYGHIAVDVFIVVSGFCLMLPIALRGDQVGSWRRFYFRRIRRIFPAYYASLAVSGLFILLYANKMTGTVWDNALPVTWKSIWSHVLLIHNLPLGEPRLVSKINYPLWSIAVEFQLYLLMPLLVWSFRRIGTVITVCVAVAIGLIGFAAGGAWLHDTSTWYLGLFALGAAAGRIAAVPDFHLPKPARLGTGALWLLVAIVILAKGKAFFESNIGFIDTVVGAAAALLLLAALSDGAESGSLRRILSWRPLVAAGAFSYSLYLIHAPLLHAADRIFAALLGPGPDAMTGLLLLTIPMIIAVAYRFHLIFERPWLVRRDAE